MSSERIENPDKAEAMAHASDADHTTAAMARRALKGLHKKGQFAFDQEARDDIKDYEAEAKKKENEAAKKFDEEHEPTAEG